MKFIACFAFLILCFIEGFPQQAAPAGTCKIKGRIIDSISKQPLGYATVTAFLKGSSDVAGGMITDDKGQFTIDGLGTGAYFVKFDFIGYTSKTQEGILLTAKNPVAKLGDIPMSNGAHAMKEVTITGTKNFMENHIDKLVYNVENDLTSQGGVATDIMKKLPQVSVDLDGNVSLLGSTNVRVFINGKPSSMFDNNLAAALQSIPASLIKSIEVITSPGAQYDAQGTGGIINIILKDNKAKGINGNINLSGGSRYQNGSGNIHVKRGSLDLSASISGNAQLNTSTPSSYNRTADSAILDQRGYSDVQRNGYRLSTGFDWAIDKHNDINGSVSYNNFGNVNNGSVMQNAYTIYPTLVDTETLRNTNNYFRYRSEDWNINYKKKFDREDEELNLSYQENYAGSNVDYQQVQFLNPAGTVSSGAKGNNYQKPTDRYISADYAYPFTKDVVLNTGLKGSFNDISSNSGHYIFDPVQGIYVKDVGQFDVFNYNRAIYAAYASITFALFKDYKLKVGAREEATGISYPGDTLASSFYYFLSPSAVISRTFEKNQTIKLSYSRRIQRPGFSQVNPFVDATDPSNLSQGNNNLLPQKVHSLELSYFRFYDKGSSVLATMYYRYSADDWQGYANYYDAFAVGDTTYKNVTVSTTINAGTQQDAGINLSGTYEATSKLELRGSTGLFEKYIEPDMPGVADMDNFNYRFNTNIVYKFDKTLSAEFYGNYNSPRTEVQGKYPAYYYYSFAIRKQFMDKKASLSFSTSDPFNRYIDQVSYVDGPNFTSTSDRQYPNRVFTLSFNYKFGKIDYKEKKDTPEENTNDQPSEHS